MNVGDIVRPEPISLEFSKVQVELSLPIPIYNADGTSLEEILIAPTLVILNHVEGEEKSVLPIDAKMFNNEIYQKFNSLTYSIGKLVRLAELNLDTLQDVLELYFSLYPIENVLEKNKKCKGCKKYFWDEKSEEYNFNKKLSSLTYGNLRGILSCVVKTDENFINIPLLDALEKKSNFTSIYEKYIKDRDRYTHGQLFFLYPNFEPTLRVLDKGNDEYIKFTKEVFESNLSVFIYLQEILNEIRRVLKASEMTH